MVIIGDNEDVVKKEFEKFDHEWSDSMRPMLGKTCSVKTKLEFKDQDIIVALSYQDGESQNERLYFPKTVLTKTVISNDESINIFYFAKIYRCYCFNKGLATLF